MAFISQKFSISTSKNPPFFFYLIDVSNALETFPVYNSTVGLHKRAADGTFVPPDKTWSGYCKEIGSSKRRKIFFTIINQLIFLPSLNVSNALESSGHLL
jgi:hypothetical protein